MSDSHAAACTFDAFEPLKGEIFDIVADTETVRATLIEATNLREGQGVGQRSRQFSLVWRGPPGRLLPERICAVSHPSLGRIEMLLVNLGPDAEGMRYEAVFT